MGQSLVASGFFAHVTNDHNLEDAKLYYRLQVCACDVIFAFFFARHRLGLIVAVRQKQQQCGRIFHVWFMLHDVARDVVIVALRYVVRNLVGMPCSNVVQS